MLNKTQRHQRTHENSLCNRVCLSDYIFGEIKCIGVYVCVLISVNETKEEVTFCDGKLKKKHTQTHTNTCTLSSSDDDFLYFSNKLYLLLRIRQKRRKCFR